MKRHLIMYLSVLFLFLHLSNVAQNDKWYRKGVASEDPIEKIECFTKSIEKSGPTFMNYYKRGDVKVELMYYQSAISDYLKALEINSSRATELDPKISKAYFLQGIDKYFNNDYSNALIDFSKAIEFDSTNAQAYEQRGLVNFHMFDFTNAISDFSKAIELNPSKACELKSKIFNVYHTSGSANWKKKDYHGAISDYSKIIELNPQDSSAYEMLGQIKSEMKDYKGAISDYLKAIEIIPSISERFKQYIIKPINLLNSEMIQNKDYQGIILYFSKIIENIPDVALLYECRAFAELEIKEYQSAISDYTKTIELAQIDKENYQINKAYYFRATVYEIIGQFQNAYHDYVNARVHYNKNGEYFKNLSWSSDFIWERIDVLKKQGMPFINTGKFEKVIAYQPLLFGDQINEAIYILLKGDSCIFIEDFKNAINFYYQAKKVKEDEQITFSHKDVEKDFGSMPGDSGVENINKKIEYYGDLIKANPKDYDSYVHRGDLYYRLADIKHPIYYQKAIDDYSKAIAIDSTKAYTYKDRAWVYEDISQYSKAINDYTKWIEMANPKSCYNYYNRGLNYFIFGQIDKALFDFSIETITNQSQETVDKMIYHYIDCIDYISFCYIEKKKYDKAIAYLTKSSVLKDISREYDNARTPIGLSIAYYLSGDKVNARKYFENARKIEPDLIDRIKKVEKSPYNYFLTRKGKDALAKMFLEFK